MHMLCAGVCSSMCMCVHVPEGMHAYVCVTVGMCLVCTCVHVSTCVFVCEHGDSEGGASFGRERRKWEGRELC